MFTILLSFQIIYPWDVCLVESRLYHLWHQVELRGGFWFLAHMSMNWSIKSRELLCIKPTYYFYQIVLRKSLFQETFYFWLNSCDNHPLRHKRIKFYLKFYILCCMVGHTLRLRKSWSLTLWGGICWHLFTLGILHKPQRLSSRLFMKTIQGSTGMKHLARSYIWWTLS